MLFARRIRRMVPSLTTDAGLVDVKPPMPESETDKPVSDEDNTTTLESTLLRHELFQHINESVVKDLANSFEEITVVKGQTLNVDQYALSFLIEGSLQANMATFGNNEEITFKIIRPREPISSILQTLSILVNPDDTKGAYTAEQQPSIQSTTLCAIMHSTIATLSIQAFSDFLATRPELTLLFTDVLTRRLFFATFPFAQRYLGLEQDVLEFEAAMSFFDSDGEDSWQDLDASLHTLHKINFRKSFVPFPSVVTGLDKMSTLPEQVDVAGPPSQAYGQDRPLQSKKASSLPNPRIRVSIPQTKFASRTESGMELSLPSALTALEGSATLFSRRSSAAAAPVQAIKRVVSRLMLDALHIELTSNSFPTDREGASTLAEFSSFVELGVFQKGALLAKQDQRLPGVFLIVDGELQLRSTSKKAGKTWSKSVSVGAVLGHSSVLANSRALSDMTAASDLYVGFLPRDHLAELGRRHPRILIDMARKVLKSLPQSLRNVHCATDYVEYAADEAVYHKGDFSHSFYIVASGRLRESDESLPDRDAHVTEIGKGQSAGALELYLARKRPCTLRAIRKSHVLQIQKASFQALSYNNPALAFRFSEVLAASAPSYIEQATASVQQNRNDDSTIQTIAVVAISPSVPRELFASTLAEAIAELGLAGGTTPPILSPGNLKKALVAQETAKYGGSLLENYLLQVEDNAPLLLYLADNSASTTWSKTCIAHADVVLFVGAAEDDFEVSTRERELAFRGTGVTKKLVMLHFGGRSARSGLASKWMKRRPWISAGIQHVSMPARQGSPTLSCQSPEAEFLLLRPMADFHRLARRVLGKSIALVLGGGGARGIAHLGVLKALDDYNVPVDMVGGTSIGAFVGAIYASNLTWKTTFDIVQSFSRRLSFWRFLLDITYPWLAVTSGRRFNSLVKETFGDIDIEDQWLEYYCATTNLSRQASSHIFSRGTAWDVIRASMSFVGFVPPLWKDGELLLDGCYSSNVPVSYAMSLRADTIFAIDVGADKTVHAKSWGSELSTWSMAFKRFFPNKQDPPKYGWVVEILTEAMSQADVQMTRSMENCHYTKAPVGKYRGKEFAKFEEIYEVGYRHARQWLEELKKTGKLDKICVPQS